MRLFLVRHGQTEWSAAWRHTGRTDVPLTPAGEGEARHLAALLAGHRFARVLTSPLQRARRTAELAGFPAAEVTDLLRELEYGEYEGRTTAEIREERPGWEVFRDGCPGGESLDAAGGRVDELVLQLAPLGHADVLLFAHGHILRILGARWIGAPPMLARNLKLYPASVCVLGELHDVPTIDHWNRRPD